MIEDTAADIARRLAAEREARGWSLASLATRSGVSKAMLSKIERREASPTAAVLVRIAAAFGLTLAELLTAPEPTRRLHRSADQAVWVDPAVGYRRRQVYLSPASPLELVEVELSAGAEAAFPAATYLGLKHVIWVIEGRLTMVEGEAASELGPGDRLELGPPSDVVYRNRAAAPCRYLVAVLRS